MAMQQSDGPYRVMWDGIYAATVTKKQLEWLTECDAIKEIDLDRRTFARRLVDRYLKWRN